MMQPVHFSRRDLFRVGAAGLAGLALPASGRAAEEPTTAAPQQGAGFYRLKLGDFEAALVSDGVFEMPASMILAHTPPEELAAAMEDAFLPPAEPVTTQVNALLVKTLTDVVLIDTGCGDSFGPTTGKLVEHLGRFGVKPAEVTLVVLSHLHGDHVGGLATPIAGGEFANARIVASGEELAFWREPQPDLSRSFAPLPLVEQSLQTAKALLAAFGDRIEAAEPGREVAPGIELVAAPGHTPGHVAVRVRSGDAQLLYLADTLHMPAVQLQHVGWPVAFDVDPVEAIQTRKAMLQLAVDERSLVLGAHLPFPALGRVRPRAAGYDWVPAIWRWDA